MTRKDLARRMVLEAAVLNELKDANAATRDEARLEFESGDAEAVRIEGVEYGRVRRDKLQKVWKIVDYTAFETWVRENLPHLWIPIYQVHPSFRNTVTKTGEYIDKDGVVLQPDGLALVEGEGNVVVTTTKEAQDWALTLLRQQMSELER